MCTGRRHVSGQLLVAAGRTDARDGSQEPETRGAGADHELHGVKRLYLTVEVPSLKKQEGLRVEVMRPATEEM